MEIKLAVIVAAGWGTRFLPITKSQPKEMLPLVNKPLIQYSVEEAIKSGIKQIIIVTAMGKRAIEDYFDRSFQLESFLESKGENKLLEDVRYVAAMADICSIRQKEQLGLGHAVLTVRNLVGNMPFAVMLPDDVITGNKPVLKQLMETHCTYQSSVLAIQEIAHQDTAQYGIIKPGKPAGRDYPVLSLVEKPLPEVAPSNLAIVGRYILAPAIFDALMETPPGKNQEIQLTDALQLLLKHEKICAHQFEGTRYDAGTPLGWLKTNITLALQDQTLAAGLREYLSKLSNEV